MSLRAEKLTYSYKMGNVVLADTSLEILPGERVGLVAPSGAGKTTLMRLLGGFLPVQEGYVEVDGRALPTKGYCPVQMIGQHPELYVNPRRRMKQVLKEGDRVESRIIKTLGIEDIWLERFPHELSGGELQRFNIARALGSRTRYLLADEITTMLDVVTQCQIWEFLIEECERRNIGILAASHDEALLSRVCTRMTKWDR